jgi:3'(2'), 5'-bisphosphate nucleotidase
MSLAPASTLLRQLGAVASDAAEAILAVYRHDFSVRHKDDSSPVTAADLAAQEVILAGLAQLQPNLPVVSEEARAASWDERRTWSRYWLVDPLDGTREFIKRNGEFTVNIALIEDHRAVAGVVLAPVNGELYLAAEGEGAWWRTASDDWQPLRTRQLPPMPMVAGSRSHGAEDAMWLQHLVGSDYRRRALGSSLKFCLIARGAADVYLRRGATSEWDTAAGQCVLEQAGGAVLDLYGQPFRYNRGESLLNPEFLAVGDPSIDWAARLRHAREGMP